MNPRTRLGLGLLVVGLGAAFALSGPARSQPPAQKGGKPTPTTKKEEKPPAPQLPVITTGPASQPFTQRLAAKWNVNEAEVAKRLEQLGQEVQKELAEGRTVEVPGVGTLRVVTVHQHRETVQGRPPVYVEKRNTVQLVPVGGLAAAANSPGAKSMEEILPGNYFYHDIYTGNGLNREPPNTVGSGRDLRPANNPSNKVGGRRNPGQ